MTCSGYISEQCFSLSGATYLSTTSSCSVASSMRWSSCPWSTLLTKRVSQPSAGKLSAISSSSCTCSCTSRYFPHPISQIPSPSVFQMLTLAFSPGAKPTVWIYKGLCGGSCPPGLENPKFRLIKALSGDWTKHLDFCLDRQWAEDANKASCVLPLHDLCYYRDIQVTFEQTSEGK